MIVQKNVCDSTNVRVINELGPFKVIEHQKDMSVSPYNSVSEFYSAKMNVKRRQVLVDMQDDTYGVILQAGAMQWMSGSVSQTTGVKGGMDFLGKMVASKVTKESAIKPEYTGPGSLMLEPTYKHIILMDVSDWGTLVLDDGLFLACENTLQQKVVARSNVSSAILGGEGLFNMSLTGKGIVALESKVPMEELIEVKLEDDVLKIDGNLAIAWSGSLSFTVEKSAKSLLGSAVSGEGLVNVYRGTGRVLMAPTASNNDFFAAHASNSSNSPSDSKTQGGAVEKVGKVLGTVLDILS